MRRAVILALGTYGADSLSPGEREPLIAKLLDLYEHDPDAGIHGAAEWALRQWKQEEKLKTVGAELSRLKDRGERLWYVNGQGQTFVLVAGPVEFRMGSPANEPDRYDETLHHRVITRRFAIAANLPLPRFNNHVWIWSGVERTRISDRDAAARAQSARWQRQLAVVSLCR